MYGDNWLLFTMDAEDYILEGYWSKSSQHICHNLATFFMSNSKKSRPQINTIKLIFEVISWFLIVKFVHSPPVLGHDVLWFFFFSFDPEYDITSLFPRNWLMFNSNAGWAAHFYWSLIWANYLWVSKIYFTGLWGYHSKKC